MNKEVLNFAIEKTHELIGSHTCCIEAKTAGQRWLDSLGTESEISETQKFIEELEADIVTIDNLISFSESEAGAQTFGTDSAKAIAAHAKEIKAAGATYCDCPACVAALAILEKKDSLLR